MVELFATVFLIYGIVGGAIAIVCAVIFTHSMLVLGRFQMPPKPPVPPFGLTVAFAVWLGAAAALAGCTDECLGVPGCQQQRERPAR